MEGQNYLFASTSSKSYVDVIYIVSQYLIHVCLAIIFEPDPEQSSALICAPVATRRAQLEGVALPAGRKNNRATFGPVVWLFRLFRHSQTLAESWDEGDSIKWANSGCRPGNLTAAAWLPTPALCRGRPPIYWRRPPLPGAARCPPHIRWPTVH